MHTDIKLAATNNVKLNERGKLTEWLNRIFSGFGEKQLQALRVKFIFLFHEAGPCLMYEGSLMSISAVFLTLETVGEFRIMELFLCIFKSQM